jgi:hypothetical protein
VCSIFLLIASCAGYTYYDQGEMQRASSRSHSCGSQLQQLQQRQ